ncbi:hypothetical protein D3C81_1397430 [compost metagenome]
MAFLRAKPVLPTTKRTRSPWLTTAPSPGTSRARSTSIRSATSSMAWTSPPTFIPRPTTMRRRSTRPSWSRIRTVASKSRSPVCTPSAWPNRATSRSPPMRPTRAQVADNRATSTSRRIASKTSMAWPTSSANMRASIARAWACSASAAVGVTRWPPRKPTSVSSRWQPSACSTPAGCAATATTTRNWTPFNNACNRHPLRAPRRRPAAPCSIRVTPTSPTSRSPSCPSNCTARATSTTGKPTRTRTRPSSTPPAACWT